jgi:hypothetical protein
MDAQGSRAGGGTPLRGGLPQSGTLHVRNIDPVEQHRELGRVEPRRARPGRDVGNAKSSLLQSLVKQQKSSPVPDQNLNAIASLADKREQVTAKWIESPALDDREQPIMPRAHVYGLRCQVHAPLGRKGEHGGLQSPRSARTSAAT